MARPTFTFSVVTTNLGPAVLAAFQIEGGVTTPDEFAASVKENTARLVPPEGHGIIVDGRGPVWGFGMILHESHPSVWTATRDPRLGMVVTATHTPGVQMGQVAEFPG